MTHMSLAIVLAVQSAALAQPVFYGLGDLPDGVASRAAAVSGDGLTVVGWSASANGDEAFVWKAGRGISGLGDLDGGEFGSRALAVSGDGSSIVGSGSDPNGAAAFHWTQGDGLRALGGESRSAATAVSADGSTIAGWIRLEEVSRPFTGTNTEVAPLDPEFDWWPGASAVALSADGSVAAGWLARDGDRVAWVARDGDVSVLPSLPGAKPAIVICMSSDGSALGGYCWVQGRCVPTVWRDGEPSPLAAFKELEPATVLALSQGGTVGVGRSGIKTVDANGKPANRERAVIWTAEGKARSIADVLAEGGVEMNGWTLREATGVSADGTVICGDGTNPEGRNEAWVADLKGGTLPASNQN